MNRVLLDNVNLHYSSLAFRETSLKAYLFKMLGLKHKKPLSNVHALKNIQLEIKPGERIGLIGHNGAGKSTLLKAIAGLYPISSGRREVRGKIRALFELHLGFEQEATGRENILYRGLLLGQTPRQMHKLTDEIIAFTDIGEFIDYPIKTYSAGMLVRLAFAISTAIPGDLLLLDEVIGAGDADFLAKSKNRINQLIQNAQMMVLASHDFKALRSLCNRAIVMHQGSKLFDGSVDDAIDCYQNVVKAKKIIPVANTKKRVKTIGVFLPAGYRGGSLNGAKNIAKMLHLGSRHFNEPVNVVFSCIENEYHIAEEMSDLLALGIPVRETRWKLVSREEVEKMIPQNRTHAPALSHANYSIPCLGSSHFEECDFWMIISDRLKKPLAPIKPYGMVIYDYIQRYVPKIFDESFTDSNFIAAARGAAFVLTTTPYTREDAIQYAGLHPHRVLLAPMEFDPYHSSTSPGEEAHGDFFLWPSNATQHKNHLNAIEALNIYYEQYNGKLSVIMTGQNTHYFINNHRNTALCLYFKEVIQLIEKYPAVKKHLNILGNIPIQEYINVLQSAKFLWHPTLIDNGTYAVIEAACSGVPSLSGRYPQMQYMNERFELRLDFCEATDPEDMAKQLKHMEEQYARKRALLPKKEFLEKFSYKNIATQFWPLVRGLI